MTPLGFQNYDAYLITYVYKNEKCSRSFHGHIKLRNAEGTFKWLCIHFCSKVLYDNPHGRINSHIKML